MTQPDDNAPGTEVEEKTTEETTKTTERTESPAKDDSEE